MSEIVVSHPHNMNHDEALALAAELAAELAAKHHLSHHWEGETMHFDGAGVHGHIGVSNQDIRITVKLGWLLLPLRGMVEKEISTVLDEHFD